jgi:cobalamin-dependent methionine synthase I
MKKSEKICFFLCSIGNGISDWNKLLFAHGDFLKGYLVDLAGSILADKTVEKLSDIVELEASAWGMGITNTYSPGYCEWPVEEQQKLFGFFPENFCGVKLTPSSLMIPEKSVSGIIGGGNQVKKVPYTCAMCNMKNCIYAKPNELIQAN